MFSLTLDADPDLKTNLNGYTLFTVELVLNIEGTFSNNAKLATHVENTFIKCVRLSFFVKKLQKLSTPVELIRIFFLGVLVYLNTILLCLNARLVCGLTSQTSSANVTSRLPPTFSVRIHGHHQHPLHDGLLKARSHKSTRSRFNLLRSKTVALHLCPSALWRLLVDRNAELNLNTQNLSWGCIFYSAFHYCSASLASTT